MPTNSDTPPIICPNPPMIPPSLAALLSSLVSQLSLLILLLHPSSLSSSLFNPALPSADPRHQPTISLLLHHLHATAAAAALTRPLKRKRTPTSDSDSDSDDAHITISPRLQDLRRVDPNVGRDPGSFRTHFNMAPSTFEWLLDLLEPLLDCRDPVGSTINLSPQLRLGIGLYRLSTGSAYPDIARVFRVTEPVARFCCKHLCRVLCTNFRFWVGFPSPNELESVSEQFKSVLGLPNCCGVIDCVRFRIKRTCGKEEIVAAQIVVDSNCRILNIVAGLSGGKTDWEIMESSTLYNDIESGKLLNSPPIIVEGISVPQFLIGDSGYPLLPWLVVPFLSSSAGSAEEKFNAALRLARKPLLRSVGSLKRWGVLSKPIEGELRHAVAYIAACAILHNALLLREDFSALSDSAADDRAEDHNLDNGFEREQESTTENNGGDVRSALAKMAKLLTC